MSSYFPILIKISNTNEERVVDDVESLPIGEAFTVLKTNCKKNAVTFEDFRDTIRNNVLEILDELVYVTTLGTINVGAEDKDLPALFNGLDNHAKILAHRHSNYIETPE